ncbi:MAG TPA: methyltransferase domain-containing protein [Vicinamibacteria bacterium]|nr:methyltransferase domain-containing protein [Vicinamibacteria bacterium]
MRDGVPILLTDPSDAELVHESELGVREGYDPWLHRMIIQSLNDDQVVLEFGSGNMSLDDPCIIRMDVKLTPHVDLVADLHSLPFKPGTIDFAFGLAVFEHLRQPFVAAEQLYDALRAGGYVYGECNFVFAYHGYPHHYFNASIHGLEQVFRNFTKLRLGIAPFQMPSFALENVIQTYVALFHADTKEEADLAERLNQILSFPLREYDSKFTPESAFRLAAGGYYLGIKQPTGSENVIPPPVWNVFLDTRELRDRFRRPLDLASPDNLMYWARSEGRQLYPEIARYYDRLQPFSKHADRPTDRKDIRGLTPIPDYDATVFGGIG